MTKSEDIKERHKKSAVSPTVNTAFRQGIIDNLTPFGKCIYYLRMGRFWKDGDIASFLWNWWNPLTLILISILIVPIILFFGLNGLKEFPGIRLSSYWKEHKDERIFF